MILTLLGPHPSRKGTVVDTRWALPSTQSSVPARSCNRPMPTFLTFVLLLEFCSPCWERRWRATPFFFVLPRYTCQRSVLSGYLSCCRWIQAFGSTYWLSHVSFHLSRCWTAIQLVDLAVKHTCRHTHSTVINSWGGERVRYSIFKRAQLLLKLHGHGED